MQTRHFAIYVNTDINHSNTSVNRYSSFYRVVQKVNHVFEILPCELGLLAKNVQEKHALSIINKTVLLSLNNLVLRFPKLNTQY